jgi:hypothetical protein
MLVYVLALEVIPFDLLCDFALIKILQRTTLSVKYDVEAIVRMTFVHFKYLFILIGGKFLRA